MIVKALDKQVVLKETDTATDLKLQVLEADGITPVDLTAKLVTIVIGTEIGRVLTKPATYTNELGHLHFGLDNGDLLPSGDYLLEIHIAEGNEVRVAPSRKFYKLKVENSIDSIDDVVTTVTLAYLMGEIDRRAVAGPMGPEGPRGFKGDTGPIGPMGPTGPQGPEGPRGLQGPKGDTGPVGPVGPEGKQGIQGPQGPIGLTGERGLQGPQGIQGPRGEKGADGRSFTVDSNGTLAERDQYDSEPIGFSFLDTESGSLYIRQGDGWSGAIPFGKGDKGEEGPEGPQGPQGVQGPKGEVGPVGPVGPQGPIGPVGPKGEDGKIEDLINVKDFGAIGDNVADDTEAIRRAISYANDRPDSTLLFPRGVGYRVLETIVVPPTIHVKMVGRLVYSGTDNVPVMIIGNADTTIMNKFYELRVSRSTQSDWSDEQVIGVKAFNLDSCHLNVLEAQRCTIGVQAIGSRGFAYSKVVLGRLVNNKIALDLTTSGTGWTNDNIFEGGRMTVNSGVHTDKSRYGIRITSGGDYRNNNNVFEKPAMELSQPTTGEALPILVEYGIMNKFKDVRNEGNGSVMARFTNQSTKNHVTVGYASRLTKIEDLSTRGGNVLVNTQIPTSGEYKEIYKVVNIHKKATPYDSANLTRHHVAGLVGRLNSNGTDYRYIGNSVLGADHLELTNSGLGVYVNTENVKEFYVGGERLAGFGGRIIVVAYGSDGKQIVTDNKHVVSLEDMALTWASGGLGRYQTGSDSERSAYFKVSAEVKKIFVGFASGTNSLKIRSFFLEGVFDELPPSVDIAPNSSFDERLAVTPPTTGTWAKGDFVRNDNPVILGETGKEYFIEGWKYTTSGLWLEVKSPLEVGGSGTSTELLNYVQSLQSQVTSLMRYQAHEELLKEAKNRIDGGTVFAHDMNGNLIGMTLDEANSQNIVIRDGKMMMIAKSEVTKTVTDSTVVASAYDTSGNGGRKLVRLSNGWLVAVARVNNYQYFYVSKNQGILFEQMCFMYDSLLYNNDVALVSKGTMVYVVSGAHTSIITSHSFEATTISNVNIYGRSGNYKGHISPNESAIGNVSLTINPEGTELHATWSSKNATYPNSFNIRYAKGVISQVDGSVTWGTVEQVTAKNTTLYNFTSPSIVVYNSSPLITFAVENTSSDKAIAVASKHFNRAIGFVDSNNGWGDRYVNTASTYAQSSPSAIFVPQSVNGLANGRIWVAWHGSDSTNSTDRIRYSYSDDGGVTWSAMQVVNSNSSKLASITFNKKNEGFIGYQAGFNTGWVKILTDATNQSDGLVSGYTNPSTLVDTSLDFSKPLVIAKGTSKVGFYGTWKEPVETPTLTARAVYDIPSTDFVGLFVKNKFFADFPKLYVNDIEMDMDMNTPVAELKYTKSLPAKAPVKLRIDLKRTAIQDQHISRILGGRA